MSLSPLSGYGSSALSALNKTQQEQARIYTQLSTAKRINSAADDPAGLVISNQLTAQVQGQSQASANISQAGALLQTADGGLEQSQSILGQMRDLALRASNSATSSPAQTSVLNQQFTQLSQALDRVASQTSFGKTPLLDGSYTNQSVQTGSDAGQNVNISIESPIGGPGKGFNSQGLGLAGANLSSPDAATDALQRIDAASDAIGQQRGNLGALQSNTFDSLSSSLSTQEINLSSSLSTIADTDYAQASAEKARGQILMQANSAMLVQGNQIPRHILSLLG